MKILIVDDNRTTRKIIQMIIENEGYETVSASNGCQAMKVLKQEQVDLIISDIDMPEKNGFELLKDIYELPVRPFIIIMTGLDKEQNALKALQLGADNFVHKPVHRSAILYLLKQYKKIIQTKKYDIFITDYLEKIIYNFSFDNNIDKVSDYVDYLLHYEKDVFSQEVYYKVKLGLIEIVMNAMEHGNLEISYNEKTMALESEEDRFYEMYQERLSNPEWANRKVHIVYERNKQYCEWTITDEGSGFDFKQFQISKSSGLINLETHGRGILISQIQFDELNYYDPGNKVKARIYFKKDGV